MMPALSPLQHYQQALAAGFVSDSAQAQAVAQLQRCFLQLQAGEPTLGVYLWGPVGRGKTWLMDRFFAALQSAFIPARRQHFHHFMQWLHQRLSQLSGTAEPLQRVANELATELRVLCFDEFFINDIGDAMLLGPLLQALFNEGVVLVATSNEVPLNLYANGFNRERIVPALQALQAHVQVVHLDGGQDHRLHGAASVQRYWVNASASLPSLLAPVFVQLTGRSAEPSSVLLNGRPLTTLGQAASVVWCSYADLCEGPWAAPDYIQLCQQFKQILLSSLPPLSAPVREQKIARGTEDGVERVLAGDRPLVALSPNDNGVRRLIALVDECYEQGVPLYIEAAVPLAQLYQQGALLFPFQRTLSRLAAMQRERFPE